MSALRDISAAKRDAQALYDEACRYRSLVQNSPVCIHEMALNGTISSINKSGLAMLGAIAECELQGHPYLDAVCPPDRQRIGELLASACAGETSHFEFEGSGPTGRVFQSCLCQSETATTPLCD